MSHANQAVALLTTQSIEEAEKIAEDLDILNKERQLLVDSIVQEAIAQLAGKEAEGPYRVLSCWLARAGTRESSESWPLKYWTAIIGQPSFLA